MSEPGQCCGTCRDINHWAITLLLLLLAYALGFHVGHYCGFKQRDLHLQRQSAKH